MKEFKFFQKGTLSDPHMLNLGTRDTSSLLNTTRMRIEDGERAYRFEIRAREESRRMMLEEVPTIRTELKESLYVKGSIKLKPKWWMRVKMFFQRQYYLNEDFIPFTVSILTAISIFIILTIKSILLK